MPSRAAKHLFKLSIKYYFDQIIEGDIRMAFSTEQENFWAGGFGADYLERNQGEALITTKLNLFSKILARTERIGSIAELGCNIGLNLQALNRINKNYHLRGYEINKLAADKARDNHIAEIINDTIVSELDSTTKFDLTFTAGVLIHINPEMLGVVYDNLYRLSNRYLLICEYYNPSPVQISYRGNEDKLFKRDFAGEMIERFNLKLIDYGFNYQRDLYYTNDDSCWFLMEKI